MAAAPPQLAPSSSSQSHPPPLGASATTQHKAASSEEKMSNIVDLNDESNMGPNANYQPNHAAQYPQPAYSSYPRPGNFAVDQDMSMVENFAHSMQPNMSQMDTTMQESNGHAQGHGMSISTSNVPGMAPPQTPHQQSFSSPTGPRPSMDGSQDLTNTGDGSKRKRSKVSRACDECRRKKIRCDATDDDGNVKTCSNCARSGQTCEYSRIPMKRGPSKGYIKELSERVQQVESQMAMSGGSQATGYRQSLDGSSMPLYPESSYSPDEPMSLKRNFSFSEPRTNPFSQPHFNRDRMPSTGAWSSTSNPSGARPRDRGSIAVAPDQLPDAALMPNGLPAINYAKPFWAQDGGPPAKRQKVATDDEQIVGPLEESELLQSLELSKSMLPLFATPEACLGMTRNIPTKLQHAVLFALSTMIRKSQAPGNTFQGYGALEDYVWDHTRISPDVRSTYENNAWMLLYLCMIINTDQDLARFRSGDASLLSKGTLLKLAIDLGRHLKFNIAMSTAGADAAFTGKAWNLTCLLARLYAISSGTEDPVSVGAIDYTVLNDMPPSTAFLIRASDLLSIIITTVQAEYGHASSKSLDFKLRKIVEQHLDFLKMTTPTADQKTNLVTRKFQLYVAMLNARYFSTQHPVEVLTPTLELVELLTSPAIEPDTLDWDPLTIHLFALSTITLLELVDTIDTEIVEKATQGLSLLVSTILGVIETLDKATTVNVDSGFPSLYGMRGLHKIIASRIGSTSQQRSGNGENGPDAKAAPDVGNGDGHGEPKPSAENGDPAPSLLAAETTSAQQVSPTLGGNKIVDAESGTVQLIDFRLLLRYGYMNVVSERNRL